MRVVIPTVTLLNQVLLMNTAEWSRGSEDNPNAIPSDVAWYNSRFQLSCTSYLTWCFTTKGISDSTFVIIVFPSVNTQDGKTKPCVHSQVALHKQPPLLLLKYIWKKQSLLLPRGQMVPELNHIFPHV